MRLFDNFSFFPLMRSRSWRLAAFAEEQHSSRPANSPRRSPTTPRGRTPVARQFGRRSPRPEVHVASSMHGLDLARATAAVETMTGADLEQAANAAKTGESSSSSAVHRRS